MRRTSSCLDEPMLRRLARGRMAEAESAPLERHLDECPRCAAAHDALFAPLIDALRTYEPADTPMERERIDGLIARVERLVKTPARQLSDATPWPALPPEVRQLGPYRVLGVLGQGGMGTVYEGEERGVLKRRVALKVIKAAYGESESMRQRFLREARAASSLDHPNVVPVWHVDEQDGIPFIAMPLLKGESLAARLKRDPQSRLPVPLVLQIARETAAALQAAHAEGLVHRDVKPGNIWLEECGDGVRVRVLDFGLARVETEGSQLTQLGALVGTPQYMAPEQARGEAVDGRADLFSLGCVLYELLTRRRPFDGRTVLAVLGALENHRPAAPHEVDPAVPVAVSRLVMQLLEKSRDRRPASAREVAERLRAIEPPPRVPPPWPPPVITMVAAAVLAVLLPGAFLFGGVAVRFASNQGQVVIEADDPAVEVTVKNNGAVINDPNGKRTVTLAAGDHELEVTVKEGGGEVRFFTSAFTLRRGGKHVIRVRREAAAAGAMVPPKPTSDREAAEWVLSVGGGLYILPAEGKAVTVAAAKDLPPGRFLFMTISLFRCMEVRDGDLARLSRLTELGTLDLRNTPVTDAGLAHIKALRLRGQLRLGNTSVGDTGLGHLVGMTELPDLDLNLTRVTDRGLAHLRELTRLAGLHLHGTKVSDEGLRHLQTLQWLRTLDLTDTQVTDGGLARLKPLWRLERLWLTGCNISDEGLAHLHHLRDLQVLDLARTRVTAGGVAALKKALPNCQVGGGPGGK